MSSRVRDFEPDTDYKHLVKWWEKQEWDALPLQMLPKAGFVAEVDGVLGAATWAFNTGSPIYLVEFTVGNPDLRWEERSQAIIDVTNHACDWSKRNGASFVLTMTKSKRLIEKLKDNNFTETDRDMVHLLRSL